jgi:hypothetical protein
MLFHFIALTPFGQQACTSISSRAMESFVKVHGDGIRFPGMQHSHHDRCGCDKVQHSSEPHVLISMTQEAFYKAHIIGERGTCKFDAGLEVGALHNPAPVPHCARGGMLYVDQATPAELAKLYPELTGSTFTKAHLIDDGNVLKLVPTASRGFLIASNVIEHMPNTLLAVEAWLRVLRVGGIALIRCPWKCATFDRSRPVTSWSHFVDDYRRGQGVETDSSADSLWMEHLAEWTLSDLQAGCGNGDIENIVSGACALRFNETYSRFEEDVRHGSFKKRGGMHFHTWTLQSWLTFWTRAPAVLKAKVRFEVQAVGLNQDDNNLIVVLKKRPPAH